MTPGEYAQKYRKLRVYTFTDEQANAAQDGQLPPGGHWIEVDVHRYRIAPSDEARKELSAKHVIEASEKFGQNVRPHIGTGKKPLTVWVEKVDGTLESRTYHNRMELGVNAYDAFSGKANPEEMQVTLQLAMRFGLVKGENLSASLQSYCDNNDMGLDCNGFVGNYLRHVVFGKPWFSDPETRKQDLTEASANMSIELTIRPPFAKVLTTVEEIGLNAHRALILAKCDVNGIVRDRFGKEVGHLMIADPHSARLTLMPELVGVADKPFLTIALDVIESTGGLGLMNTTYHILQPMPKNTFEIYRGSKHQKMHVKIAALMA